MRGSKRKLLYFIPLTLTLSLREREPKALRCKSCQCVIKAGDTLCFGERADEDPPSPLLIQSLRSEPGFTVFLVAVTRPVHDQIRLTRLAVESG
ncbi:protein of unknown function [Methylocaldum szegediense]|uniref:Secreted protein n=1 Tax=Methylocaldum szegediense TaxID=73780 RepID=A0ABM9I6N4_9GAMM|nr:protein of unknown function [Methylocaldum szegediense]